ncbi:MAG: inositol phosphorylceramide synthase [Prevotella sp.]|nr:inositol phosphorylceramide synthase [Prevotella sp.]
MYSIYIILLYLILVAWKPSRKIAIALTPWLIFACSYDWMRLLPNYEVNPIDVRGIYEAEKSLFGITVANGSTLIPGEYFNLHNSAFADFWAGFFYLCWVPVPLGFAIYLYLKGEKRHFIHFSIAFLFINLLGFVGYYIYPAAPPWYVINHGFEPVLNTPGSVAGLIRFDNMMHFPVFQSIYSGNSNVFAAVPSLHAAYMLITTVYAVLSKQNKWTVAIFAFICVGIWWTAVYSTHHYIIDVILGIITAILGLLLLEKVIMKIPAVERFIDKYVEAI